MGSFIVEFWSRVFEFPQYISPNWWLKQLLPAASDSYRFVDAWVLGRFFGSAVLYVATAPPSLRWLESIAVAYGGLMVIEAFFYEINVLIFGGYRAAKRGEPHNVLSHRRLVITSLMNYAAIIFWFALFYRHWQHRFVVELSHHADRILTWLALSFNTMTGFGHVQVEATTQWADGLLLLQTAIGVAMALLIVVSFVRLLPKPGTKDPWEARAGSMGEGSLNELARMGKERNMTGKDELRCALGDDLCSLAAGMVALGMWRAVKPERTSDKALPYALAAILGSMAIGAVCLGFAYQFFSIIASGDLARPLSAGDWILLGASPGWIFLVIGCLLVSAGLAMAAVAAISRRSVTDPQQLEEENEED